MSPPRIIAGKHRGRRLEVPPGDRVRPTADRLREALFSILEHQRPGLAGARFVDLFAGCGAVGLEALSRGAAGLIAVEADRAAAAVLKRNVAMLGETARCRLLVADATRLGRATEPASIVYLDPPYESGLARPALLSLEAQGWLDPATLVVVELAAKASFTPPAGFVAEDERRYGAGRIVLLRAIDPAEPSGDRPPDR